MALRLVGDLTLGLSHSAGILGGASAGEACPSGFGCDILPGPAILCSRGWGRGRLQGAGGLVGPLSIFAVFLPLLD